MHSKFIQARVIKTDQRVRVKQGSIGSDYFITDDKTPFHVSELDFNVNNDSEPLPDLPSPFKFSPFEKLKETFEANSRDFEVQFWRNFRAQIFLRLHSRKEKNPLGDTDAYIDTLYLQHQCFIKKYFKND